MNKTPKLFILAGAVLAFLFLFVSIVYNNFVQKSIYEENSRHLLSTYEQVDKTLLCLSSTTGMHFLTGAIIYNTWMIPKI